MKDLTNNLKHELDIQLFTGGEGGNDNPATTPPATGVTPEIDYVKLAEIVNGRITKTEDSVLKGYFKQQGLSPEEAAQAMDAFKQSRQQSAQQEEQKVKDVEAENTKLKAQILNANIDSAITDVAVKEGIVAEKIPFLLKFVEREGLTNESGDIIDDKAKQAVEEVIKAFPDFKGTATAGGFQQIGAGGGSDNIPSANQVAFQNGRIVRNKK